MIYSYAIQNFKRRSTVNRWTPKKNLLWVLKNNPTLYLLNCQLSSSNWHTLLFIGRFHIFQKVFKYAFRRSFVDKTSASLIFKHSPLGFNLGPSLKYWIVRNAVDLAEAREWNRLVHLVPKDWPTSRYYVTQPFFLSRATKKLFKSALYKLMTYVTLDWSSWDHRNRHWQQHTHLTRNFFIFRFINLYYFKVFNL